MSLESEILALLSADATLANLVGTRIYPALAPQGAPLPYVVYSRTAGRNLGTLGARGAHDLIQVEFDCVAEETRPMDAVSVALALRKVLDSYSSDGALQAATFTNQLQQVLHEPRQLALFTLSFSILVAE
jgi:Protein of unknown function (DUF3168)